MFIFLEGLLAFIFAPSHPLRPVTEIFTTGLSIDARYAPALQADDYCVNTLLHAAADLQTVQQNLRDCGSSIVLSGRADRIKVHLHTPDRDRLRRRLTELGTVTEWCEEHLTVPTETSNAAGPIHIMTDAAGSLTREDARQLGVTLLSSYLTIGDRVVPETLLDPTDLYAAMAAGIRVTTAQASVFERRQSYQSVIQRFDRVLYLCVGAVYTGNYQTATRWQAENDAPQRLTIIDTGSASGRLGIAAMATARFARTADNAGDVETFARTAVTNSRELVFLDTLKYLAAGGRISKTKGFFGDLLHLKPIISPEPEAPPRWGW
ncbi:DegV family protein [Desulfosarcina cetonica]|uniref:DegV family protein n=1 Tax=Desulfosarcina cetonica TaxID=90730 RepID=UPI0009F96E07|nr:DegV family protein [Desulfosarcina cetonica]